MPGRIASSESYRYGFQGQEKDDEIKGPGNSINYKYRMHDPRMGRFLSVDPLAPEYPWNSPYAFSENKVIRYVELEGLETRDPMQGDPFEGQHIDTRPLKEQFLEGLSDLWEYFTSPNVSNEDKAQTAIKLTTPHNTAHLYWKGAYTYLGYDVGEITEEEVFLALEESAPYLVEGAAATAIKAKSFSSWARKTQGKRLPTGKGPKPRCFCFTEDTWVMTDSSFVKIPEIQVGDHVWAFDDSTGEIALKPVTKLYTYQWHEVYQIYLDTTLIEATHEHPFFVQGEWVDAEDLAEGDTLTRYDGKISVIDSIHIQTGSFQVYNFEVEEYHSYFVTEQGVLVHNAGPCTNPLKRGVFDSPNKTRRIKARLEEIRSGKVNGHDYANDGRNNSQILPKKGKGGQDISYKTYDLNDPPTPEQRSNGAKRDRSRLLIGSDGSVWYTNQHYNKGTVKKITVDEKE